MRRERGAADRVSLAGRPATFGGGRAAVALCVSAFALCLALSQVTVARAAPFIWSGRSTTSAGWSLVSNWKGQAPTSSTELESLIFPPLTSGACTVKQALHRCYLSTNDLSGLSTKSITLDDGVDYLIDGAALTLGAGGLHASPPEAGTSAPARDTVELPLQLGDPQRWEIADRSGGAIGENGLVLGGEVSGSGSALVVGLSNGPVLALDNHTEVGPVTLEGPKATGERIANGSVLFGDGELNSADGNGVELRHVFFAGTGALGALTTEAATLDVGSATEPAGALQAASVSLDAASGILFEIMGSEMVAQSDYSQLVSEGPVQLAGAIAVEVGKPNETAPCPVLLPGQTYTLLSTPQTLSGTFTNAPEGGPELAIDFEKECGELAQTMRISYNRSAPIETVTGTVEEEAFNNTRRDDETLQRRGEEAAFKAAQEQANLMAEEAAKRKHEEEAAAAAAKRQQEEAAAKVTVLSVKEHSPDATIADTKLQVSASGAVRIKIDCVAGASVCTGTLTLRTLNAVIASAGHAGKTKAAILTLAAGSFTVPGGEVKTVTVHLSAKARDLVSRSHTLRVRARVVAHNPAGATHAMQTTVMLRAPKAQHRKD